MVNPGASTRQYVTMSVAMADVGQCDARAGAVAAITAVAMAPHVGSAPQEGLAGATGKASTGAGAVVAVMGVMGVMGVTAYAIAVMGIPTPGARARSVRRCARRCPVTR